MEENKDKSIEPVPYFIHEGTVTRLSECNKKLLIALIVAVTALFLNNSGMEGYSNARGNRRMGRYSRGYSRNGYDEWGREPMY
jgi:hypothetical protein